MAAGREVRWVRSEPQPQESGGHGPGCPRCSWASVSPHVPSPHPARSLSDPTVVGSGESGPFSGYCDLVTAWPALSQRVQVMASRWVLPAAGSRRVPCLCKQWGSLHCQCVTGFSGFPVRLPQVIDWPSRGL